MEAREIKTGDLFIENGGGYEVMAVRRSAQLVEVYFMHVDGSIGIRVWRRGTNVTLLQEKVA